MPKKRIYISPPHMGYKEMEYIKEAFASNWIAPLGPQVNSFEEEMARYVGTAGAAALSSGTAAIHLALRLLGIGSGDRVFCSTLTFCASANPILYQGATPIFIDSEPDSWNMSPAALHRALADADQEGCLPKAVVIVNLYGQSADYKQLLPLCEKYGVPVIEDAAESLGASYAGKKSGSFGRFGIFSFNGNKMVTTSGGGMLVADDLEALTKARFLSAQACDPAFHYQHSELGYNYRLSNILAAIGRAQLQLLDERVQRRREIFIAYQQAFADVPGFAFMPEIPGSMHNRWLTTMTVDPELCGCTALDLVEALGKENIESRPVWKPLHMQPLYAGTRFYPHSEEQKVSELLFEKGICLPSGSAISASDMERVQATIRSCLRF